ncbi:MAG: hypothetical protein OXK72_04205 [Gammaproteobacteria bacterium]|nr:hypothetical protein [Gammaproteobacteria bacterium]
MNFTKNGYGLLVVGIALLLLVGSGAHAEKPSDSDSLEGIDRGKVVWDVTVGNPTKLSLLLKVIEETYEDLVRQNVTPDMVFLYHGPVMKLISNQVLDLPLDQEEDHEAVLAQIQQLSRLPGIRMESCSISARMLEIDNAEVMPEIKPVGNTFVSLIGYQAKGYSMIPVH